MKNKQQESEEPFVIWWLVMTLRLRVGLSKIWYALHVWSKQNKQTNKQARNHQNQIIPSQHVTTHLQENGTKCQGKGHMESPLTGHAQNVRCLSHLTHSPQWQQLSPNHKLHHQHHLASNHDWGHAEVNQCTKESRTNRKRNKPNEDSGTSNGRRDRHILTLNGVVVVRITLTLGILPMECDLKGSLTRSCEWGKHAHWSLHTHTIAHSKGLVCLATRVDHNGDVGWNWLSKCINRLVHNQNLIHRKMNWIKPNEKRRELTFCWPMSRSGT